jgi:hypothetical protein
MVTLLPHSTIKLNRLNRRRFFAAGTSSGRFPVGAFLLMTIELGAMPHAYAIQKISSTPPRTIESGTSGVVHAVSSVWKPTGPKDCRRDEETLA